MLESLPKWSWDFYKDVWDEYFDQLVLFTKKYKHSRVTDRYVLNSINLGSWVSNQRMNKNKLSKDKINKLEKLPGWTWDVLGEDLEEGMVHLKDIISKQGHSYITQDFVCDDEFELGLWLKNRRSHKFDMADSIRDELESIKGWEWTNFEALWELLYSEVKEFSESNGHILVPMDFQSKMGININSWIKTQKRTLYSSDRKKLREFYSIEERKRKLESLPGWFDKREDVLWNDYYSKLREFLSKKPDSKIHLDLKDHDGNLIGNWAIKQKKNFNNLKKEQIEKLEKLPNWSWAYLVHDKKKEKEKEKDTKLAFTIWGKRFKECKEYFDKKGKKPKTSDKFSDGGSMGYWVKYNRDHKNNLTEERKTKLESIIGWSWSDPDQWGINYNHLKNYYKKNKTSRVPQAYRINGLGSWVQRQRDNYKKNKLTDENIKKLEIFNDWQWSPDKDSWNYGFNILSQFIKINNKLPTSSELGENEFPVGSWSNNQRVNYKYSQLNEDKIEKLEGLVHWKWVLVDYEKNYNDKVKELVKIVEKIGSINNIKNKRFSNGILIKEWITRAKEKYSKGRLTKQQTELLENLNDWNWRIHDDRWDKKFFELESMIKADPLFLNDEIKQKKFKKMNKWVIKQRTLNNQKKLSQDRVIKLSSLNGWLWQFRKKYNEENWEEAISELKIFAEKFGHARPKQTYENDNGYRLGRWVQKQRAKKNKLTNIRKSKLESIVGWVWEDNGLYADVIWDNNFLHLQQIFDEIGHININSKHKTKDGFNIGQWVGRQRRNKDSLTKEKIDRLNKLNFVWKK